MRSAVPVKLTLLRASDQPRPTIPKLIDQLAQSLKEVGLIQPITVRPAVIVNGIAEAGYRIVAGHHRVAAARALGWEEIDAFVIEEETTHLAAELVEIDENLCRAELTPAQRAAAVKRRKQIWEAMHPVEMGDTNCSTHLDLDSAGRKKTAQQKKGFAAETAELTGQTKTDINRHIARAEAIPQIERAAGTSLDSGVELDALGKLPLEMQTNLLDKAAAGEQVSARATLTLAGVAPKKQPKGQENLVAAFAQAVRDAVSDLVRGLDFLGPEDLIEAVEAELEDAEEGELEYLHEALSGVQVLASLRKKLEALA